MRQFSSHSLLFGIILLLPITSWAHSFKEPSGFYFGAGFLNQNGREELSSTSRTKESGEIPFITAGYSSAKDLVLPCSLEISIAKGSTKNHGVAISSFEGHRISPTHARTKNIISKAKLLYDPEFKVNDYVTLGPSLGYSVEFWNRELVGGNTEEYNRHYARLGAASTLDKEELKIRIRAEILPQIQSTMSVPDYSINRMKMPRTIDFSSSVKLMTKGSPVVYEPYYLYTKHRANQMVKTNNWVGFEDNKIHEPASHTHLFGIKAAYYI